MLKSFSAIASLIISLQFFCACSDNESTSSNSEKFTISLDSITGFSQKGPFVKGSDVRLYELEEKTLKQTSGSFAGKIIDDNGRFRINARDLTSPYVYLQATGYFQSEISGEASNGMLSLEAISDVRNNSQININLMTHLEYNRVMYLITQKDSSFSAAKKRAQQEIFNIFHINAANFEKSEKLNLTGTTEADAALIAISAILISYGSYRNPNDPNSEYLASKERDCDVATLTDRLMSISTDIEEDGKFNNNILTAKLADNVEAFHRTKELIIGIRSKLRKWGGYESKQSIPNYEKYLNNFWATEYGLGSCDSTNVFSTKENTNSKSINFQKIYTCLPPRTDIDWNEYFGWDGYYGYFWLDCNNGSKDGRVQCPSDMI